MKKFILSAAILLSGLALNAQSLERFVIASSGNYSVVGSINFCYTVGELAAVESFLSNPLMHLTQGFQQPNAMFTGIERTVSGNNGFSIYPNPAKELVAVHYEGFTDDKLNIRLYNVLGQLLRNIEVNPQIGQQDYVLDLSGISQGLYLVELSGKFQGQEYREQTKLNVID